MLLADSINRLFFIMEVQYVYMQLGNEFIDVIQAKFASFNFTWLSAKGHTIELRRCEQQNCNMLLHRKLSLALCEVDINFRWS
jgi:hypothetical protein